MKIEIINSLDDFYALEPVWNQLLQKSGANSPFMTFEWCRAWLETFGDKLALHILTMKDNESIRAIAPFIIKKNGLLTFIGYPQNDYAGFIINPNFADAYDEIAEYLSSNKKKWRKIILDQFAEDNTQIEYFIKSLQKYSIPFRIEPSDSCPAMIIEDREVARKMYYKRNITSYINWFNKEGEFRYNIYTDINNALEHLNDLFVQHINRWDGTSTPSYFHDEKMKEFYRKFVSYMHPKGWLQFSSLTFNDKYLALYISFEYGHKLILYKTSFNLDYSKKSPGQVILRYLLDYALERNFKALDFARGDEGYKDRFANAIRKSRRLIIYKNGMAKFLADSFFSFRYSKAVDVIYRNKFALRIRKKLF
jgi:CelD/BcsL family acetyltransferase involved in cellulose biosynthesis